MSSTNVAKGVAWIDKRLVGEDVDEPEEIQLDGVTQGQLHIMPGICSEVIPGPADGAIFNTGDNELSIAQKMEAQGVNGCLLTKSPAPASMAHRYSLTCWKLLSKVRSWNQACLRSQHSTFSTTAEAGLAVSLCLSATIKTLTT
jgi:hypothetical protein